MLETISERVITASANVRDRPISGMRPTSMSGMEAVGPFQYGSRSEVRWTLSVSGAALGMEQLRQRTPTREPPISR